MRFGKGPAADTTRANASDNRTKKRRALALTASVIERTPQTLRRRTNTIQTFIVTVGRLRLLENGLN